MAAEVMPRRAVYAKRFGLAYFVLAGIAGVAIGGTILMLGRPAPAAERPWSSWEPTIEGGARIREIADFVSSRYRLSSGRQLVGVLIGPPSVQVQGQEVPIRAIAIGSRGATTADDISIVEGSTSVMFTMCGLGENCAIPAGRSLEPEGLLRREALELALYTFKYIDPITSVIVFLPSTVEGQVGPALFFRRADLEQQLALPVAFTVPTRLGTTREDEQLGGRTALIDRLTLRHLFRWAVRQAPDGSALLVLDPANLLGA